ncbi:MAG: Wzz/FepE/Etk N-terminal domain-containing protein [Niabella sp.]
MDNNMQEKANSDFAGTSGEETSLKDLILSTRNWVKYFWSKWYIILLFGIIGAALGLTYAFLKKPVYTATTSFVLETGGNRSGLAAYAGIASAFGIDLGGAGGGLFEGENILELYRSRNMISRTLLSEADFNGKKQLLIERYIDFSKLRKKWADKPELKDISFSPLNEYSSPRQQLLHDSIITRIVKAIDKNYLDVSKIDKKLNIIKIKVISKDELFAKHFNEKLVENVNRFYLDTKTKKNLENVSILQAKTDSVRGIMTGAINRAVAVADATPNQNPTRMAQRVAPIQNATTSAEINKEVLGTLLQNLELSKISLLKETPLIQIVDEPVLPLEEKKTSKLIALILGGMVGGVIILGILMIKKYIRDTLTSVK